MSNVIHIFTGSSIDPDTGVLPHPGECLTCFVQRMMEAARCSDSLGWAEHYRHLWEGRLDRLDSYLQQLQTKPAKGDTRHGRKHRKQR